MIRPSRRSSFLSWTDAEFCENSCVGLWLSSLFFSPPFLEFTHSHGYHDDRRGGRVHAYSTSVSRSDGPCSLHATGTVELEQHSPLSSCSAPATREASAVSFVSWPGTDREKAQTPSFPKHRPFRGGRRKQGRCIPVLVHSLTRNRALPRGRTLDNFIQIPLTASVIDSFSCSRSFL